MIEYRRATIYDANKLLSLWEELWNEVVLPKTNMKITEHMRTVHYINFTTNAQAKGHFIQIAFDCDTAVGFISGYIGFIPGTDITTGFCSDVFVLPASRKGTGKNGIGKILINNIKDWLIDLEIENIIFTAFGNKTEAWEKRGYEPLYTMFRERLTLRNVKE